MLCYIIDPCKVELSLYTYSVSARADSTSQGPYVALGWVCGEMAAICTLLQGSVLLANSILGASLGGNNAYIIKSIIHAPGHYSSMLIILHPAFVYHSRIMLAP